MNRLSFLKSLWLAALASLIPLRKTRAEKLLDQSRQCFNPAVIVFSPTEPEDRMKIWWRTDPVTGLAAQLPNIWSEDDNRWYEAGEKEWRCFCREQDESCRESGLRKVEYKPCAERINDAVNRGIQANLEAAERKFTAQQRLIRDILHP